LAREIAIGTTDATGGWSGDIVLSATGDFVVLVDTAANPVASAQRLNRIILTNPIQYDQYSNPIGRPDDIFNPWLGSGIRALLGLPLTPNLTTKIQNQLGAAIAADPNYATTPLPVIQPYVDGTGDGQILLYVQVTTILGYVVTLPSAPVQFF